MPILRPAPDHPVASTTRAALTPVALCFGLLAAACGGEDGAGRGAPASGPDTGEAGVVGDPSPEIVALSGAVVDDRGTELPTSPTRTRVISLIPAVTEIVLALGAADVIVARTRYDQDPRLVDLPSVGGGIDPDLEALLALAPDLVIGWEDRGTRSTLHRIETLGVDVYGAETQDLDDVTRHAEQIGRLIGRVAEGQALAARLSSEMAEVSASVEGLPRRSVFYVVWPDPPQTAGAGTYLDDIIRTAGGTNILSDAPGLWPLVSLEAVVARDPDYLVVPAGAGGAPVDTTWLRSRAGWRSLTAVQEGRVLVVDADLFSRPGPGIPEAARILRDFLHPGAGGDGSRLP